MLRPSCAALAILGAGLSVPLLAGCHPAADAGATIAQPASTEQKIADIQNNPHMPPQAKAAALAQMKRAPTTGSMQGAAPPAAPPAKK